METCNKQFCPITCIYMPTCIHKNTKNCLTLFAGNQIWTLVTDRNAIFGNTAYLIVSTWIEKVSKDTRARRLTRKSRKIRPGQNRAIIFFVWHFMLQETSNKEGENVITPFRPSRFFGYSECKIRQSDQPEKRPESPEHAKIRQSTATFLGWRDLYQVWPDPWPSSVNNWLINFPSFEGAHENL